jgi:hypothetical protein
MRTTVDIPDPTYRQLKAKAAVRGCSVKELILRGVEAELNGKKRGVTIRESVGTPDQVETARLAEA